MKLPIPYEKAILIYEAFGQIKEKQPIPELILEFITMEIEIFFKGRYSVKSTRNSTQMENIESSL